MNNVDKALLMHKLLPESIGGLLTTMKAVSTAVIAGRDELEKTWNVPLLSASMWVKLAEETLQHIEKYESKMLYSAPLFADQLFDGYNAMFANHCMLQHTKQPDTARFTDLFNAVYGRFSS